MPGSKQPRAQPRKLRENQQNLSTLDPITLLGCNVLAEEFGLFEDGLRGFVRICWKRPQALQLWNRSVNTNAALESWLGERPQGGKGVVPLS